MRETDNIGRFYEVDISYPHHLHDTPNDMPFMPHASIPHGSSMRKMMVTFLRKERYVVHYMKLKQAMAHGVVVEKTYRVLEFRQSPWLALIVGFFKRSEVGNRVLIDKQKQLGITQILKVKQDVRTRWNSTLFMLERLVKLKEPLTIAIISLIEAPVNLDHDEWKVVEDIITLLKPFDSLTVELSAEQYPTISKVIPLIRGLQGSLVSKDPKTIIGQALKTNLINQTSKRFDGFEKQTLTPGFSRATLLDPRFKKAAFGVAQNANDAEKYIISEIADLLDASNAVNEHAVVNLEFVPEQVDNVWEFLQSKVTTIQSQSTATSGATALIRQYLSIPHQKLNCNIFTFWNQQKSALHPIGDIAEKYAIIPATSVPSERIFSKAGQILCARRNRLLPENLDTLIFLSKNM
ncbi:unnamed protein product [Macrosiphum euphorbiae]|uniref:HAT C-terminal dimerisation domain-containing protein n=1 Tax=Macrosiphum euphorbiae TaxID=13131 RepID=A0AAV0XUK3_9HEMI|nr:unnamed protein product [Macrosiphum euphorbiae]